VDTATDVVFSILEENGPLCDKAIYRVAMANAERQEFETARELASRISDPFEQLFLNIEALEEKHGAKT
jgi:hypothetical protein